MTQPSLKLRRWRGASSFGRPDQVIYEPGLWLTVDGAFILRAPSDLTQRRRCGGWRVTCADDNDFEFMLRNDLVDRVFARRRDAAQALTVALHSEGRL